MKKYKIEITDQADNDLRGIFEYIAFKLEVPKTATKQLNHLEEAINNLETFPERYVRYEKEPWYSRNLRLMTVNNYCVFFIVDNKKSLVTIIRIIYGGRDIETQLRKYTKYNN